MYALAYDFAAYMYKKHCVILFADLVNSVGLYDRVGDEAARNHVLSLQRLLQSQFESFDGLVLQVIGDEQMVSFDDTDQALACSISLHRAAQQYSLQHAIDLHLRVGMHYGEVIDDPNEQRLFGDTLNLASRVTGIAQADQTILTEALINDASSTWNASVRQFDITTVKGKSDPLVVYDLPWQHDDLTAIMPSEPASNSDTHSTHLALRYRGNSIDINDHDGVFTIGRAITNNLVVDADPVSRRHVTIEKVRDHFVLSDKSTNGTHLFTDNGEALYLRRQQWPMSGSGELALGASKEHGSDHIVEFHCSGNASTG